MEDIPGSLTYQDIFFREVVLTSKKNYFHSSSKHVLSTLQSGIDVPPTSNSFLKMYMTFLLQLSPPPAY